MCTFGVLGLSCEAPAAPKPPGLHTTAREPKRAHVRALALRKHYQNSTKGLPREEERKKIVAVEGQKSEILGGPYNNRMIDQCVHESRVHVEKKASLLLLDADKLKQLRKAFSGGVPTKQSSLFARATSVATTACGSSSAPWRARGLLV